MFRRIRTAISGRTEGSDEPESYKKVRVVEMDGTTAQIATDEGEFTVYDVSSFAVSTDFTVEINDLDYSPNQLLIYVEFKNPVTIRARRIKDWVRLTVVA